MTLTASEARELTNTKGARHVVRSSKSYTNSLLRLIRKRAIHGHDHLTLFSSHKHYPPEVVREAVTSRLTKMGYFVYFGPGSGLRTEMRIEW